MAISMNYWNVVSAWFYFLLLGSSSVCVYGLSNNVKNKNGRQQQFYNYFAYGSNMASSTMRSLRKLNPTAQTAAILPNYQLCFTIPGSPGIEPSWAAVVQTNSKEDVHGVLYRLTEEDFIKVCQTEGVPFAYRLQRCRVIPYIGDGNQAGETSKQNAPKRLIKAYTLIDANSSNNNEPKSIPPSQSYLNVLIRGAKEFGLDQRYVQYLENIPCGKTFIGNGIAETMLQLAEITTRNNNK